MNLMQHVRTTGIGFVTLACVLLTARPVAAYVEVPYALGRLVSEATNVVLMRVEKVDREKNLIVYRKVRDVKGTHPGETIKHQIGQAGFHPREWQGVMAWAEVGKTALFMHNGSAGEVCIDTYWYQCYPGDWWAMSHAEPYLLRSFAGKPEKLATAVEQMLGGQEVTVPCMVDGDKQAVQLRTARLQRMKASLKIQDYDAKRDFAGWGVEEFKPIAGMPGFTHIAALTRVDPAAIGAAPVDFDLDGKADLLLYGASKVALLQNAGGSLSEISLPLAVPAPTTPAAATANQPQSAANVPTLGIGARGAAWGDYNGDGKPDLLLATPAGPRLFTNTVNPKAQGQGAAFKDDSGGLPSQPYSNVTAAAWLDYDMDGKPDVLLADGFQGLRLYRNLGKPAAVPLEFTMGKWWQCGPFENTNNVGFDTAYPPEQKIDLKGEYPGKNASKATWKETAFNDGNQANSVKLYRDQDHTFMTVYLYRELTVNQPAEVPAAFGAGGPMTVWVNGQKVSSENVQRAPAADQQKVTLKLKPGKNTLLVKACYVASGRSFYANAVPPTQATPPLFEDVSDKAGLGTGGVGGRLKGDHLAVADVNGDGRLDFLYSAGTGLLALNTANGFVEAKDSGVAFRTGRVAPVFGDFDNDKKVDLFVPQATGGRLLKGDGAGRFADVTAKAGALAAFNGNATSAAWADFTGKGRPDLLVACLKGPNRLFRNNGDGTFADAGDEVGLYQRVFNTRALCVLDFNKDGAPDVVFNNEGQESALLLGRLRETTATATAAANP